MLKSLNGRGDMARESVEIARRRTPERECRFFQAGHQGFKRLYATMIRIRTDDFKEAVSANP